jgi:hypothetical protein
LSKIFGCSIVLIFIGLIVIPILCLFLPISWLNSVTYLVNDRNGAALMGAVSAFISSLALLFLVLFLRLMGRGSGGD